MPTTLDVKPATSGAETAPAEDPIDDFNADLEAEENDLQETIGDEIGDDAGESYETAAGDEDDVSTDDDFEDDGLGYGDEDDDLIN